MDKMYKAINIVRKGFDKKETITYYTPDLILIADYAFNTGMYKKDFFSRSILDLAGATQSHVIRKPDGIDMSQNEVNKLIENYYPKLVTKLKAREKFQKNLIGKKLVQFNLLAPWHILYFKMTHKERGRIDILNRLYSNVVEDKIYENDRDTKETTLSPLETRMSQHIEEVRKMPHKI